MVGGVAVRQALRLNARKGSLMLSQGMEPEVGLESTTCALRGGSTDPSSSHPVPDNPAMSWSKRGLATPSGHNETERDALRPN